MMLRRDTKIRPHKSACKYLTPFLTGVRTPSLVAPFHIQRTNAASNGCELMFLHEAAAGQSLQATSGYDVTRTQFSSTSHLMIG